jgi:Bacterial Ig-like domain (group 3)
LAWCFLILLYRYHYLQSSVGTGPTNASILRWRFPIQRVELFSSINSSVFGQSVNFTAAVNPSSAIGSVTFKDGSKTKNLETAALSGGSVTFNINSLAVGSHSITVVYGGDANNNGSTSSSVSETVVARPVIATTSLPNGRKIALTARHYRSLVDRLHIPGQ